MNTREKAEGLVQELYDMACEDEVGEVLVLCRHNDGRLLCAYASDDMQRLVDETRVALADMETEIGARSRRLN